MGKMGKNGGKKRKNGEKKVPSGTPHLKYGAGEGIRTLGPLLGKQMLYP